MICEAANFKRQIKNENENIKCYFESILNVYPFFVGFLKYNLQTFMVYHKTSYHQHIISLKYLLTKCSLQMVTVVRIIQNISMHFSRFKFTVF